MGKLYSYNSKLKSGYALMLSIVVSSIVLSIGLSLFNIVQKELILSATGRDSQFAFYSADGGIECALYWDIKQLAFPESGVDWYLVSEPPTPGTGGADCGLTDFTDSSSRYVAALNDGGTAYECVTNPGPPPVTSCSGNENDIVTVTFQVKFQNAVSDASPGSCAQVTITKDDPDNGGTDPVRTTIESKGYNDECQSDGAFDNPALVERAISVVY
ncbi:MAG: hypothetical protein HYY92_02495 [Parcubacteria group bacterium]|nr:hypothetical protein [Parcubacteria group bacterium]